MWMWFKLWIQNLIDLFKGSKIYDHVLEYINTVWTNSEKNIPHYLWWQDVSWCVLSKPIVPMSMIQAKKMVFGAQKSQISRIFSEKMPKIAVFYVARNCVHRKHVDQTNLLKLFRPVYCVLKTVYQVYFMIQSSQLLLPLPFRPVSPSFLCE